MSRLNNQPLTPAGNESSSDKDSVDSDKFSGRETFKLKVKKGFRKIGEFFARLGEDAEPLKDTPLSHAGFLNGQPDSSGVESVGSDDPFDSEQNGMSSVLESKRNAANENPRACRGNSKENRSADDVKSMQLSPIKFAVNTSELISEYDRRAAECVDEGRKSIYEDSAIRLIENLILSGCMPINPQEDELYDFKFHESRPFVLPENQKIEKTIRLGVRLEDRILVKAIVALKDNTVESFVTSSIPEVMNFATDYKNPMEI